MTFCFMDRHRVHQGPGSACYGVQSRAMAYTILVDEEQQRQTADAQTAGGSMDESSAGNLYVPYFRPFSCKSQENGRDFLSYSVNQESIQMKFMADLMCNFIR